MATLVTPSLELPSAVPSVSRHLPFSTSQSLAVLSPLPLTRYRPSALNCREYMSSSWPTKVCNRRAWGLLRSQSFTSLSSAPVAKVVPVGSNATERMYKSASGVASLWASWCRRLPVAASKTCA
jgi:hypothetical protein